MKRQEGKKKLKIQRLRKKEVRDIIQKLLEYGVSLEKKPLDRVEVGELSIFLYDGEPLFLEYDGRVYFTIYGVMKLGPKKWKVVVDEGAMPYIMNGADVMKPGIIEADSGIKEGNFVYILVEGKESPIAVGVALCDGNEMIKGDKASRKGKAIKNIHHLKDKIWNNFFYR